MDYFVLSVWDLGDDEFCYVDDEPEGMSGTNSTWRLRQGEEVRPGDMPSDKIHFSKRPGRRGIRVTDVISNHVGMLIVSARVKAEVFDKVEMGRVQYLPIKLINHKKRVASAEHVLVNPLGTFDVLSYDKSSINWFKGKVGGEVVRVDKPVLSRAKLKEASPPDVFRYKEDPRRYVISQRVLDVMRAMSPKPTNAFVRPLEFAK